MFKKDGTIYFDERVCGSYNKKLVTDFSFALNTETHEVIYNESKFFEEIKEYLEGKSDSNLVNLDAYYPKFTFDSLIREILGLKGRGYFTGHHSYIIPETLTLEDFNKLQDYNLVYSITDKWLNGMVSWYLTNL